MRKLIICVFVFMLAVPSWAAQPQTEDQKALYALGVHLTKQLSIFNLSTDEYEFVKQGMTDVVAGKKLEAEPEAYQQKINQLFRTRMEAAAQKQKELAKPYLENAAKQKDAQKMASGLIYQQIKAGTGAQPKATDIVKVHYTGTFIDGKEFDSSVKRGEPLEFPLGQVIPCWTEGVGKMKVGGKAKLVCPSDIAYGDQGRPPIPGGATLVFEVELLDVKPAAATTPASKKTATPKAKSKK
ncbi:MAG: FKBP-type peptidyl-prolyl cis-trans isomerase [Deltaproteobacteria bacterium]|nr:FKBP-type peptidyl-prolyl cis-trans isomerase [Deltaproteobacteria bacterium]